VRAGTLSGNGYHARIVASSPSPPPDLRDLVARTTRGGRSARRERPFRFLLDSRLFRHLCDPRKATALDSFRASLASQGLAPEGGLPDLEMTPLAILDVLGVEPPRFPAIPLPATMANLKAVEVGRLLVETIRKEFETAPELEALNLQQSAEELRQKVNPAAHELFDLCLARFVSGEELKEKILVQLTFDALFTFRFPEEHREQMTHLFNSFLLNNETKVSGLTRVRLLKVFWDGSFERLLKKHPGARGEVLAVDQAMTPRTFKDFLGWEVIHYSILGYARKRVHPVIAFAPEPGVRLTARCKAHKTALRAFLDQIPSEELAGVLRPLMSAWRPGWLVPCRADGTFETPMSTGEVVVL
jgi:hypothetical protein